MFGVAFIAWLTTAAAGQHPGWSELTPWRTWVVAENVSEPLLWFVVDDLPGVKGRCEVGVSPHDGLGALVWCGAPSRDDRGAGEVPKRMRRAERIARTALQPHAPEHADEIAEVPLRFLGSLRRVTLRQLVVVEPDPDAERAIAHTLLSHWDVDVDSGWVAPSPVPPKIGYQPACAGGMHTGCDSAPSLIDYLPPPGWEGLLVDPREAAPGQEGRDLLATQVLAVARGTVAGSWVPATMRTTGAGLLPEDYDAKAVVTMRVRVGREDGSWETTPIAVDVPLNVAAFRRFETRFPILTAKAELEVRAHLTAGYLDVRILPMGGEPVEHRLSMRCSPVVDGGRAALARDCEIASDGQWLRWDAPWGGGMIVMVEERVEPLMAPAFGVAPLP
jgi:hypothetical protein